MEPNFSHPKPRPTNKLWHYQFKCLFILRFWHRRHCNCLKLFETLHLPENESKHNVSNKSQTGHLWFSSRNIWIFVCVSATIRTGWEIFFLPFAGLWGIGIGIFFVNLFCWITGMTNDEEACSPLSKFSN